ncbi:zinc finger protein weckle [Drosophila kikkawai]|uniref:Zinc finger protein weckle n=1 Tax=Drosophila kikkawai TaxID=30033 RepID=A0A6P4JEL0_DROKI|nr:zinc finger protein weckle [Drosophila kikkawai]
MAAAAHLEEQAVPADPASDWHLWCRLCANDDIQGNMNVFLKNDGDASSGDLSLATAIGKYFWVNISRGEDLPEMICCECLTLVTSLVNFSERITRVQKLFCILQSASGKDVSLNVQELRSKFGLLEEAPGTEVHYVDEKPKLGIQVGLLPEEPELLEELENPLTPEGEHEEQAAEQGEQGGPSGSDNQDPVYEADDDAALVKLCDEYDFPEHSSSSKEEEGGRLTLSPHKQEKAEKCELDSDPDPNKSHQCSRCLRTYVTARSLHRHMRQDHWKAESAGSDLFTCTECSKKFRTHYQLERHSQRHLPLTVAKPKQHACNSCDKKFASSASATQHAQYMHLDERPRPVICEQCGVGLHSMSALKEHVLKHTDYAPFECDVCKKCFKSANRLKHHKETHDPHKYICPECGMQLNSRPTLNRHRLVHTDQMQHKCDYCGREFKRAKALKNHLILHTGLKPYSCDFCDRTFANGSNCRTHKKKAHPEELAAQEASGGGKTYNRNIPKLEALKAFTKNKDNLSPVATKQSGCFAFGKKPKPPVKGNDSNLNFKTDRNASLQESESEPAPELSAQPDPSESAISTIDNIYNHIMIEYR